MNRVKYKPLEAISQRKQHLKCRKTKKKQKVNKQVVVVVVVVCNVRCSSLSKE